MDAVFTIGHGTQPVESLAEELGGADVRRIVDVRAFPHSRHNPQFNKESLAGSLPEHGIAYAWAQSLGGRRKPVADSRNVALRHEAFRAYADYMQTDDFARALDALVAQAREMPSAVMCSETVWWRCHRRLIADALVLLRAMEVFHLMPGGKRTRHPLTDGVRVAGGVLIYDGRP